MAERNNECNWSWRFPNTLGWAYQELQEIETALQLDREGAQVARENGYGKPEANFHQPGTPVFERERIPGTFVTSFRRQSALRQTYGSAGAATFA